MKPEEVLIIKKMISQGFDLQLISNELNIPIEQIKKYEAEINDNESKPLTKRENAINKENSKDQTAFSPNIQNVAEKQSEESRKISQMMDRYNAIFNEETPEPLQKQKEKVLTETELDQAIQKTLQLASAFEHAKGGYTATSKEKEIKRVMNGYIKLIDSTIIQQADSINDIEELRKLIRKLPSRLLSLSQANLYIQKRIESMQQRKAFDNLRNNIPESIRQIIADIANGTLDIKKANEEIDKEARKRVQSSPQTKFALTEGRHRKQIILQIHTALKERGEEYEIKNPLKTMDYLTKLGEASNVVAVNIIAQNFINRKEYEKATLVCGMCGKGLREEENKQIYSLKKQIKAAKIGDIAKRMLTGEKSMKEREEDFELLKTAMRVEGINETQILIGKKGAGNIPVYLSKIWDSEKQR